MPVDYEDLLGRIRDYLAIIVEGINEKCMVFGNEVRINTERNNVISKLIKEAEISLTYALDTQRSPEQGNIKVLIQLEGSIQNAFISLGLSENQEQEIVNLLEIAEQESAALFEQSTQVSQELNAVVDKFNQLKE